MKEWGIDLEGVYVASDTTHQVLSNAFNNGSLVCVKIYDAKKKKGLFGGLCAITDFSLEAPHDDAVTYSLSLSGAGKLTDLTVETPETDTLPQ